MAQAGRTLSLRGTITLCALSGALLFLSFPPAGLWPLAWVALAPWLLSLRISSRLAWVPGSWLAGFVFFGALLYWLGLFGISVLLTVATLLGAVTLAYGLLARWLGRLNWFWRTVGAAAIWCAIEWVRGLGQFGFTWGWLGYSQSPALAILPVARLGGTLALSFLIALANAALAEWVAEVLRGRSRGLAAARGAAMCGMVVACVAGANLWVHRHPPAVRATDGPRLRVAVIQGSPHGPLRAEQVNRPPSLDEQRKAVTTYLTLTARAAAQRPALVVWPESALPGAPDQHSWIATAVAGAARMASAWLLTGGPYVDARGRTANSAYLYSPTGNQVARYDKVQLVPFGEYVPGRNRIPFLDRYQVRKEDLVAGAVHTVLQAGTTSLGPMICFESTFPTIAWHLCRRGAQVLVVITNDAWFGRTAAAAQHQQIAVLRAVETGRWVVRAAATGISSIIAPDGRVVAKAGLFQPAVLAEEVVLVSSPQPGPRLGPWVAWGLFGLAVALIISPLAAPRKRRRGAGAQPETPPARRGKKGVR